MANDQGRTWFHGTSPKVPSVGAGAPPRNLERIAPGGGEKPPFACFDHPAQPPAMSWWVMAWLRTSSCVLPVAATTGTNVRLDPTKAAPKLRGFRSRVQRFLQHALRRMVIGELASIRPILTDVVAD
jgi:hypothetical protein